MVADNISIANSNRVFNKCYTTDNNLATNSSLTTNNGLEANKSLACNIYLTTNNRLIANSSLATDNNGLANNYMAANSCLTTNKNLIPNSSLEANNNETANSFLVDNSFLASNNHEVANHCLIVGVEASRSMGDSPQVLVRHASDFHHHPCSEAVNMDMFTSDFVLDIGTCHMKVHVAIEVKPSTSIPSKCQDMPTKDRGQNRNKNKKKEEHKMLIRNLCMAELCATSLTIAPHLSS